MAELNILVVDDAAFIRDLIKTSVRDTYANCELFEATNGRKAVAIMNSKNIHVVLCDWEMPEVSGLEVLQWMRGDERYKKVPFIMITSRGDRDHVIAAVEAGVSEYIGKPFTRESFVSKLTKLIWRHHKVQPQESNLVTMRGTVTANVLGATAVNPEDVSHKKDDVGGAAVLMGASLKAKQPYQQATNPQAKMDSSTTETTVKVAAKGVKPRGIADVRFASGSSAKLIIKDINLQELIGVFRRIGSLPSLLEAAVLDIIDGETEQVTRINGYVRMMQAQEPHPDAETIQMNIRYVDDDPEKLSALSRYIAKVR